MGTTAKLGGFGLRSADKGIITNAANTLVVGDKIHIENQVRNVVFVSPMCVSTAATAATVDCSALTAVHYVEVDEPACGTATVSGADPHADRIVTMASSGYMMDPREVDIGDRIRIVTAGERSTTNGVTTVAPVWETRTI